MRLSINNPPFSITLKERVYYVLWKGSDLGHIRRHAHKGKYWVWLDPCVRSASKMGCKKVNSLNEAIEYSKEAIFKYLCEVGTARKDV